MPSARWRVECRFIKHKSDVNVLVHLSIRINALEELLYDLDSTRGPNRYSLGTEIGNLINGGQKRWIVVTSADIQTVSLSILDTVIKVGVPYLEKYSLLKHAIDIFYNDDKSAWLHSPIDDARAKRALGAAFLLGDVPMFHEMSKRKTILLENRSDSGIDSFIKIKKELEARLEHTSRRPLI